MPENNINNTPTPSEPSFKRVTSLLQDRLTQMRYVTCEIETKISIVGGYENPLQTPSEEVIKKAPETLYDVLSMLEQEAADIFERLAEANRKLATMFGN